MTPFLYKPAHEGRYGPFVNWLEELGLKEFIREFPLPKLVEWKWLTPYSRLEVNQPFLERIDQRIRQSDSEADLEILWSPIWSIDETTSIDWCVDPSAIPYSSFKNLLSSGRSRTGSVVESFVDGNGRARHPYVDFYLHWQAYALIDTIKWADNGPLIRTPDVAERLERFIPWIADREFGAQAISYATIRWGGTRATHFTWISHYRSTRSALQWYFLRNQDADHRLLLKRAAARLADLLGINAIDLHCALKDSLLVVAQEWRWTRETSREAWIRKAWKELQKDIYHLCEWLCMLEDKITLDYLEEYDYDPIGRKEYARLHEVLNFEAYEALTFFSRHARKYLSQALPDLLDRFPGDPKRTRSVARKICDACPPFESFLLAFKALHDDLRSLNDRDHLDLREKRPIDHFAALAVRAETCLRFAIYQSDCARRPTDPTSFTLSGYIEDISMACGAAFPPEHTIDKTATRSLTLMKQSRDEKITNVKELDFPDVSPGQAALVRAYLGCQLARNYFAHHYDLDHEMVKGPIGQFIMASTIFTVWDLLTKYFELA